MTHTGRGVWNAVLPAETLGQEDVEYYLQAGAENGPVWPATAPSINHTVTWIASTL
jgi:hypothetical protein